MKKIITVTLLALSANAFSAPPPPVFNLMVQTDDVSSALNTAMKNMPAIEKGKKYEVRVEVREHPVPPQNSSERPKEKPALKDAEGNPPPKPDLKETEDKKPHPKLDIE
ncbi:hypothetical protein [Providencia rettgeri]|uniref:Uncharacterized protein n=1 Tax=Providencia rettgeri TaxID=587 RepID=A0A379FTX5_PRORE|nr:hypothetical protein [Providencia rettgeri]QXB04819.1 hypothetical protein I6L80_15765 [Providencia rettgeri]SUC32128.1 Uncharacterised protein [Providencia rettgeri]